VSEAPGRVPVGPGKDQAREEPRQEVANRLGSFVSGALVALIGSAVGVFAADSDNVTVKAIPGAGASAVPQQAGYKSYDYTEADHKLRLVVPEGLAVVRAILVVGDASAEVRRKGWQRHGDSRVARFFFDCSLTTSRANTCSTPLRAWVSRIGLFVMTNW
jgi:hypothetical protein